MDKILEILQELYKIDPRLQMEEEKLKPVVERMLEIKPNANFDENFKLNLRNKIIAEMHGMKRKKEQRRILFGIGYFVS